MRFNNQLKAIAITGLILLTSACASTKSVPVTVNSDPLGSQVILQVKGIESQQSEWIYLGNTPLTTQRRFSTDHFNDDYIITLRVMKDGFIDQTKEWSGSELEEASESRLIWNPQMIKNQN